MKMAAKSGSARMSKMSNSVSNIVVANPYLAMIERAVRDPTVSLDKVNALFDRLAAEELRIAQRAFDDAMAAVQAEMAPIRANALNPQTKSRYANYQALDAALRPIYVKHGFNLSFDTGYDAPEGYVRLLCHVTGHGDRRTYHVDMPADTKGARGQDVMTRTHAAISAITYGRRNLVFMIFNVAVFDDDGNAASRRVQVVDTPLFDTQVATIIKLIRDTGSNEEGFKRYMGIEGCEIRELGQTRYNDAIAALAKKEAENLLKAAKAAEEKAAAKRIGEIIIAAEIAAEEAGEKK
jgi:ERF superfamily